MRSLEGLTDRFGQAPPQAVVVFSDGRARDPERADAIARAYGRMKVPDPRRAGRRENVGGDVAIVSMVGTEPGPEVLEGRRPGLRPELRLQGQALRAEDRRPARPTASRRRVLAADADRPPGRPDQLLACPSSRATRTAGSRPGSTRRPGEVSASNNAFAADLAIDHTKIRVLYIEGATDRYVEQAVHRSWAAARSAGPTHRSRRP